MSRHFNDGERSRSNLKALCFFTGISFFRVSSEFVQSTKDKKRKLNGKLTGTVFNRIGKCDVCVNGWVEINKIFLD